LIEGEHLVYDGLYGVGIDDSDQILKAGIITLSLKMKVRVWEYDLRFHRADEDTTKDSLLAETPEGDVARIFTL
jgi:hypothetical protein